VPRGEPLKAECAHFIDCIDNGSTPRTDGAEGLAVLKVLHAAEQALAASLAAQRPRA
jgi:UDP-2-acetamido-3-amino-2,3-dideoxy-glucuronate N-acetyltransferase